MATLFLSDLHLCASRPETAQAFEAFLCGPARTAAAVYILGDLFEYWAGDDDAGGPFNRRTLAAMHAASIEAPLYFMHGNRDFLAAIPAATNSSSTFSALSGAQVLDDPLVLNLYGQRTLITHGDTLCTDDSDYQQFRSMVRSTAWQQQFLATTLAERKRVIEDLRVRSEAAKRTKAAAIMDVNQAAVESALRTANCRRMIHGHTHRPGMHRFDLDGQPAERWVLADWYDSGSYLICDSGGLREQTMA